MLVYKCYLPLSSVMVLSARERKDLLATTKEQLAEVIGASGKSEELVRLTKEIVQAVKKLAEGTRDDIRNKSTATLADFVIAAKRIAQDTRAVDAASLQKLSSTRKAVEVLVEELDTWHQSRAVDESDFALANILNRNSFQGDQVGSSSGGGSGLVRGNSTGSNNSAVSSEYEKKLVVELRSLQKELAKRKEPQNSPTQHQGKTEDILAKVVAKLSHCTSQLLELAGQKSPEKESLMDNAITLARMICILLDVVDSLFVSKYPMRMQVNIAW